MFRCSAFMRILGRRGGESCVRSDAFAKLTSLFKKHFSSRSTSKTAEHRNKTRKSHVTYFLHIGFFCSAVFYFVEQIGTCAGICGTRVPNTSLGKN